MSSADMNPLKNVCHNAHISVPIHVKVISDNVIYDDIFPHCSQFIQSASVSDSTLNSNGIQAQTAGTKFTKPGLSHALPFGVPVVDDTRIT